MRITRIRKRSLLLCVLVMGVATDATAQQPTPKTAQETQPPMYMFNGTSDAASDSFVIPGRIAIPCKGKCGLYLVVMRYNGQGNFIVSLLDNDGNLKEIVANTIGQYDGSRIVVLPPGSYLFDVKASGSWQVAILAADDIEAYPLPYEYRGKGDSAVGAVRLRAGLLRATFTHTGPGNFIVMLYRANGTLIGGLANEIGPYKGSVAQRIPVDGVYYLDVRADGSWSVALSQ